MKFHVDSVINNKDQATPQNYRVDISKDRAGEVYAIETADVSLEMETIIESDLPVSLPAYISFKAVNYGTVSGELRGSNLLPPLKKTLLPQESYDYKGTIGPARRVKFTTPHVQGADTKIHLFDIKITPPDSPMAKSTVSMESLTLFRLPISTTLRDRLLPEGFKLQTTSAER